MKGPWKVLVIPFPDKRKAKATNAAQMGEDITEAMNTLAGEGRDVLHPFTLPEVGVVMVGMANTKKKSEQAQPAILSHQESLHFLQAALNAAQGNPTREDRALEDFVRGITAKWDTMFTRDVVGDLDRIKSTQPSNSPFFTRVVTKVRDLLEKNLQMNLQ